MLNEGINSTRVGAVTFQWKTPRDTGGATVNLYNLYLDDGMGGDLTVRYSGPDMQAEVEGLASGNTYRTELKAQTEYGEGEPATMNTIICERPGRPTNLTIIRRNERETIFEFGPSVLVTTCPILGYILWAGYRNATSSFVQTVGRTSAKSGQERGSALYRVVYKHPTAYLGQWRYYTVSAENWLTRNSKVLGKFAKPYVKAVIGGAPSRPVNVSATIVGINSIRLTWEAPLRRSTVLEQSGAGFFFIFLKCSPDVAVQLCCWQCSRPIHIAVLWEDGGGPLREGTGGPIAHMGIRGVVVRGASVHKFIALFRRMETPNRGPCYCVQNNMADIGWWISAGRVLGVPRRRGRGSGAARGLF